MLLKSWLISMCVVSTACTAQAAPPVRAVEAAEATVTLRVEGMHCASCSVTVRAALKRVDGVHDAKVSAAEKRAHVRYDAARVTHERLVQAVKDAGYDASVVEG